jgi:hypothetical protein
METSTTSFDLSQAILQWRTRLSESPAFRQENLDELEVHLRDSIANLRQRGLGEDEAFLIATRRVGGEVILGNEFGKINAHNVWINRALWMLIGLQIFAFVNFLLWAITIQIAAMGIKTIESFGQIVTEPFGFVITDKDVLTCFCGALHLGAFAGMIRLAWWLIARQGNSMSNWFKKSLNSLPRMFALAAGGISLLVLSRMILPDLIIVHQIHNGFFLGITKGTGYASLIEFLTLIVLTLLLARKQALAKTLV